MRRASRLRRGFRSLVYALALALAIASIGIAFLGRIVPMTGRQTLVVGGPSMAPTLPVGSAIVIEPVDPGKLAVGDLVSLRSGPAKAIVTHRIVRVVEREGALWLETKGDANAAADPSIVPASDVMGRVVVALPYAGYLVALASSPSGAILIVAVALLLLTLGWILEPGRPMNPTPASA